MAEIVLGRLKFKWRGAWVTATAYIKDDVVRFGGSSYVCVVNHTSGTWATDLSAVKWQLMVEGSTPTTTLGDISYRGSSADQRLPIGTAGQALLVSSSGIPAWTSRPAAAGPRLLPSASTCDYSKTKRLSKARLSLPVRRASAPIALEQTLERMHLHRQSRQVRLAAVRRDGRRAGVHQAVEVELRDADCL